MVRGRELKSSHVLHAWTARSLQIITPPMAIPLSSIQLFIYSINPFMAGTFKRTHTHTHICRRNVGGAHAYLKFNSYFHASIDWLNCVLNGGTSSFSELHRLIPPLSWKCTGQARKFPAPLWDAECRSVCPDVLSVARG